MKGDNEITIRTDIMPGDLGYVMFRHGKLYGHEYQYGVEFETYIGAGLYEFYKNYDPARDRVWICEQNDKIVGFLLLMHRENNAAQLRYFYFEPEFRGLGLGNNLMQLFIDFARNCNYRVVYLWTTNELAAAHHLYKKFGFILTEERPSTDFGKPLVEQRYDLVF